ncbi:hypothetical protein LOTGIDRAFT_227825 [Lottia gigantea]|uniref:Calcineurin-like phosphoesterase domain-containing protein n=1 Tax=Lottia gigantea TaxID=225164 RepID=V4CRJ1_LOTGI|nr:hypothetical protein LOTGIDRAFT_227825 [Lottia gigantea]ESP05130.1 hypothetical protein LOTGIDRAFT_227825 [Lottia gigantea]
MTGKTLKVLACGDVCGKFNQLYNRVSAIQKKGGNFDVLLCVGDFFGNDSAEWEDYKSGKIKGKRGRYTTSSGLQIAYLSGLESSTEEGDKSHFTHKDTCSLVLPVISDPNYIGIDILITSQWPRGVQKYASQAEGLEEGKLVGSEGVSEIARILRPRYHFAGLEGVFYERQPYRNHQVLIESARHTTRFIGLAKVGNKEKKKVNVLLIIMLW